MCNRLCNVARDAAREDASDWVGERCGRGVGGGSGPVGIVGSSHDVRAKPSTRSGTDPFAQPDHEMNNEPANFGGSMVRRIQDAVLRALVRMGSGLRLGLRLGL